MGSEQRIEAMAEELLGSVSQRVLQRAECPVLIVK
jgi:nucleotide-binding universal stress UspA family protein